jgi:hypothetical protein|tara:strand:- start:63 stop:179 length:117 start_codon:yes stop_codon:yes gene_type:complete
MDRNSAELIPKRLIEENLAVLTGALCKKEEGEIRPTRT